MSDFSTHRSSCIRCSRFFIPTQLSPTAAATTTTTFFCQDCVFDTPPSPTTLDRILRTIEFLRNNDIRSYYNTRPTPIAASFITSLKKDKLLVNRTVLKHMIAAPSCAICLNEFQLKESVNKLSCRHWFHYECIRKWLYLKNTCPLCRHEFSREPANHAPEHSTVTVVQALPLPVARVRRTARIQAGAMLPKGRLAKR